jgi:hypothetical protein
MPCRTLTREQATTAVYMDFEGRVDRPPVVLGMVDALGERPRQVVLDPLFAPAAERDGLEVAPIVEVVEGIVAMAEKEDRILIGWSHHEEEVVRALCTEELAHRFSARYRSAIETARRWRRRTYPGAGPLPDGNRLAAYLRLAGYRVPPAHGPSRTGKTLGILTEAFERGQVWEDLTGRRRARWTSLLGHNADDILGLRELCLVATNDAMPGSWTPGAQQLDVHGGRRNHGGLLVGGMS